MNVEKELFNIFTVPKSQFDLYEEVKQLLFDFEYHIKGKQNAEFHTVLTGLHDSLDKGGNEEKLDCVTYINRLRSDISSVYPEFI